MGKSFGRDMRSAARMLSNLFVRRLPLERETSLFLLASVLDFTMTYLLLAYPHAEGSRFRFFESNPIARYFLYGWGVRGLAYFKLAAAVVVVLICQIVARRRLELARGVLYIATAVTAGVVIYSLWLLLHHS
jgi:hypothetical protein